MTDLTDPNVQFPIEECKEDGADDVIRLRFRSAHRSSCTYQTYVQYDETDIVGWYCTCPEDSRIVGCCSHVATVFGFWAMRPRSKQAHRILWFTTKAAEFMGTGFRQFSTVEKRYYSIFSYKSRLSGRRLMR